MTTFIVYVLACVGAHRLWNFESVFQGLRNRLLRLAYLKPLTCQACNAFWIALALVLCSLAPESYLLLQTLAAYAVVRGALWVYRMASLAETWLRIQAAPSAPARPAVLKGNTQNPSPAKAGGCTSCEAKKAAKLTEQARLQSYKQRVVLLTALDNFNPIGGVACAVLLQARALAMDSTCLVQIWANEGADLSRLPAGLPSNVEVRLIVPQANFGSDHGDQGASEALQSRLRGPLIELGNAVVIVYDLLFLHQFATYAAAIHAIHNLRGFSWLHVVHGTVGARPEQTDHAVVARSNLPRGHKLLCIGEAQASDLAAYYATSDVVVCTDASLRTVVEAVRPQ